MADWARVEPARLAAAERGTEALTADELDRCARVFGLRLDDLLAGAAGLAPMTLLLRSDASDGLDLSSVLTAEIDIALGEFQRVVRDIADVEGALGVASPHFQPQQPAWGSPDVHPGDHRARLLRARLNLGCEPIPSMTKLVESLGIVVLWVNGEQVDPQLDGACVRSPRPAILVNLLGEGHGSPWRSRATIAHELCHLLFDMNQEQRQVLVSPNRHGLPVALQEMESTARAFAACLLAPTEGVRATVGQLDPSSENAIRAVGETYGVGRTLAINRLHHVFALSPTQRSEMDWRSAQSYAADFAADEPPVAIGLRGQPLLGLLRRAVEGRKLSPARARRMLLLEPGVALPFSDLGAAIAPAASPQARIIRVANGYLAESHPGLIAIDPERSPDGTWRVHAVAGGGGGHDDAPRGILVLKEGGEIVKYERAIRVS